MPTKSMDVKQLFLLKVEFMSIDNPSYLLTEMKNNLPHKINQAVVHN